jgi:hypothetical protein
MAIYVLDTNHLGPMLNKVSHLRDRILQACKKGDRFATCWPVLCELEGFASHSMKRRRMRCASDDCGASVYRHNLRVDRSPHISR